MIRHNVIINSLAFFFLNHRAYKKLCRSTASPSETESGKQSRSTRFLYAYLTFGVHGSPLAGKGVDGRGGVGGRSSSLPRPVSISDEMSSLSAPPSNGSSRLVCFIKPCNPTCHQYQSNNFTMSNHPWGGSVE